MLNQLLQKKAIADQPLPIKKLRAENEIRTRDPRFTKALLYQLSYFGIFIIWRLSISTKDSQYIFYYLHSQQSIFIIPNMRSLLKILILCSTIAIIQILYGWFELFELFKHLAQNNANPFIFLTIISTTCAIGFPLTFCTLFAGASFGIIYGSTLSIIGIFLSSLFGYAIGKFFFPKEITKKLQLKFNISENKNMFDLNFYVRALPGIPYFIQNLILGGMNSPLKLYMLLAILIQGSIAIAMNILGASFSDDNTAKYIAFIILLCVIITIRILFRKFFK